MLAEAVGRSPGGRPRCGRRSPRRPALAGWSCGRRAGVSRCRCAVAVRAVAGLVDVVWPSCSVSIAGGARDLCGRPPALAGGADVVRRSPWTRADPIGSCEGVVGCRYRRRMDQEALDATIAHLTARIEAASQSSFAKVSIRADRQPGWADDALARVAVVIGSVDRIRYCGGFLVPSEDRTTWAVEVVAITDDVLVRGTFSAERDYLMLDGDVTAWRRSSIDRVTVDWVFPPDPEGQPDEGQRGSAYATLVLADGGEIELPPRQGTGRMWDPEFLAFLPELLRS